MSDRQYIDIEGLQYFCNHGVMEDEQIVGNRFEVSLRLYYDANEAMLSDKIDAAISYADIVELVSEIMKVHSDLLENLAYRIKEAVVGRFPAIESGMVKVSKPHPPICTSMRNVSFSIEW